MGLSGKALLEASKYWSISWIGASGAHSGHVHLSKWQAQWEIGKKALRGVDGFPLQDNTWSSSESEEEDALPLRQGAQIEKFTTKVDTSKSGFRRRPIYFASIQFNNVLLPPPYQVVGGEQMIWSPAAKSFTVALAIQECAKEGCRNEFSKPLKDVAKDISKNMFVAYLGIANAHMDQVYGMTHPGQKMDTGTSRGKWTVSKPLNQGPFDEV
jgi:hypothetical protein